MFKLVLLFLSLVLVQEDDPRLHVVATANVGNEAVRMLLYRRGAEVQYSEVVLEWFTPSMTPGAIEVVTQRVVVSNIIKHKFIVVNRPSMLTYDGQTAFMLEVESGHEMPPERFVICVGDGGKVKIIDIDDTVWSHLAAWQDGEMWTEGTVTEEFTNDSMKITNMVVGRYEFPSVLISTNSNLPDTIFRKQGRFYKWWRPTPTAPLQVRIKTWNSIPANMLFVEEYKFKPLDKTFECIDRTLFPFFTDVPQTVTKPLEEMTVPRGMKLYCGPQGFPDLTFSLSETATVWKNGVLLKEKTKAWVVSEMFHGNERWQFVVGTPVATPEVKKMFETQNTNVVGRVGGWRKL